MLREHPLLFACALIMVGCSNVSDPKPTRDIGFIAPDLEGTVILAPDTVLAGQSFQATINTFGSSSCTIPDGVDLFLADNAAIITPYDRGPGRDVPCTGDWAPRPHPVELHFTVLGQAEIQVVGYGISEGKYVLTSVAKGVAVRPAP